MPTANDSKLQLLTLRAAPAGTDLLYLVIPGDADPDRRIPLATLAAGLHDLLEVAAAPVTESSPGTKGQWYYDPTTGRYYQCVDTDTWIILPQTIDTFDHS